MNFLNLLAFIETNLACQACKDAFAYGGKDAAGWAILFMLMIIVPMATVICFFIYRIAQRQKDCADSKYDDPFLTDSNSKK